MVNYDYAKRIKRFDGTNNISFVPAKLRQIMVPTGDVKNIPNGAFVTEANLDFITEDGKFLTKEQ